MLQAVRCCLYRLLQAKTYFSAIDKALILQARIQPPDCLRRCCLCVQVGEYSFRCGPAGTSHSKLHDLMRANC
jgi:hypothetical protein